MSQPQQKSPSPPVVHSARRSGGWSGRHQIYYASALRAPAELKRKGSSLKKEAEKIHSETGPVSLRKYRRRFEDYLTFAATSQVLCAMAVEGLVNFYGVLRLGELYYTANLERLPLAKKLEQVLQICDGFQLPPNHRLLGLLGNLSKPRNELVHPKAKEYKLGDPRIIDQSGPLYSEVNRSVESMKEFYQLFGSLSADTLAAVEFFRRAW